MLNIAQHALHQAAALGLIDACATSSTHILQSFGDETLRTAMVLVSNVKLQARPGAFGTSAASGAFHAVTVPAIPALEGG